MKVFGPEKRLLEGRAGELSEGEERLYSIIVPEYQARAVKLDDFNYKDVEYDKLLVKQKEDEFRKRDEKDPTKSLLKRRSELFEAVIIDQIGSSDWLGGGAEAIPASHYDDYINGTDTIIEFPDVEGIPHLAFAIDVTESKDHVHEKFEKNARNIKGGRLTKVKYFRSDYFKGELLQVPRVIIGADRKSIRDVVALLLDYRVMKQHPSDSPEHVAKFKKIRAALGEHTLQFKILFEIKAQLEASMEGASRANQPELVAPHKRVLDIINSILDEKLKGHDKTMMEYEIASDEVFSMIMQEANEFVGNHF